MKRKLAFAALAISLQAGSLFAQTKVIAHKGFWDCKGSAENSVASLSKAQEIKVYGSEFDVHVTKDGVPVLNHDATIQGITIEENTYDQLKDIKLANGESLPTLEQYFIQGKKNKATKLILELKPHKTKEAEDRAVAIILAMVKKHRAEKITEYISFSMNICKQLISQAPNANVAYLNGELAPDELKKMGFTGLDYNYKIMQQHPEWIQSAHDLGLSVNIWTINDPEIMTSFINQGADYITTDKPLELAELIKK